MKKLTLSIDFDGTIAHEEYPDIGDPLPGAKQVINTLYEMGHIIIINSCRAGKYEQKMKEYLYKNGIKHHFVNENPPWRIEQYEGLDCRKIGADYYIDDRNLFSREINWPDIFSEIMKLCRKPGDMIPVHTCEAEAAAAGELVLPCKAYPSNHTNP